MPPIRVLVVDDAVVVRKLITETLRMDPDLEIAGIAANGRIALQKIPQVNPDIVTLDLEMPEMDGLATLVEIRKDYPALPVIIFSTLSKKGAAATLEALSRGANDYVTKPENVGSVMEAIERLHHDLIPKIKAHCRKQLSIPSAPIDSATASPPVPAILRAPPVEVIAIGTSTGGPNALAEVFRELPAGMRAPILIVQHMPPMFTAMLAERLTNQFAVRCREGVEGQLVEAGQAYIAPGGRHMEIVRTSAGSHIRLHDGPMENSCRPAVDVLFRSVAASFGSGTLGVILTGMGQDGLLGCRAIKEAGGAVITQDEGSSVVWGMPGVVAQAGIAERILPLSLIASEIIRRARPAPPGK